MSDAPLFQIKKVWQFDKLSSVFLFAPVGSSAKTFAKKIFLKLSLHPHEALFTWLNEKPEFTPQQHALNELMRKNLENAVLFEIVHDVTQGLYVMSFRTDRQTTHAQWYLLIEERNPRSVELVKHESKETFIRHSSQGTFTKRKAATIQQWSGQNVLDKLCAHLLGPQNDDAFEPEASEHIVAQELGSSALQREVKQRLKRRARTLRKSLDKFRAKQRGAGDADVQKQKVELLRQYQHLAKEGDFQLTLQPEITGLAEPIEIELDPDKSIGQNIDTMYQDLKRRKRGASHQQGQEQKLLDAMSSIEGDAKQLDEQILSDHALEQMLRKHGLDAEMQRAPSKADDKVDSKPYKTYLSEGLRVLVGKGSSENDELTKQAKANDFWIHAVGFSGSHVLVDGSKYRSEDLPERIFRDAAILAIHYSKARNSLAAEVYYTRRHRISKKKGMPPGLWNVELAKTVFVRYTEDELKLVLAKLES